MGSDNPLMADVIIAHGAAPTGGLVTPRFQDRAATLVVTQSQLDDIRTRAKDGDIQAIAMLAYMTRNEAKQPL